MFGFWKSTKGPLADPRSAQRWLATLPPADAVAQHTELTRELEQVVESDSPRTPAQLQALFRVDAHSLDHRRTVVAQYLEHATRSSRIENQLWTALFSLSQTFLTAYQAFARDIERHPNSRWHGLQPELICRQLQHLALVARARMFRHEHWIPARWTELHGLMTQASSLRIERRPITLTGESESTTIEHQYLRALVLLRMDPGSLTARQAEYVWNELDEWCAPLRLTLEPSAPNPFYVDLAGREGLRRRKPGPLESRVLFLDTRPLHAELVQHALVLEQKIREQPLSGRTPQRSEQLALFTKLAARVDPEYHPLARRGDRMLANGLVDAIVGLQKIAAFFKGESPSAAGGGDGSYTNTLDLAVFGRIRDEPTRQREMMRRRIGAHAVPGGPWELQDGSANGFKLVAPIQVANAVTLGTLVALHPHGTQHWSLCVVRRINRTAADRADIGVELIADGVATVSMTEQQKRGSDPYSVDGEGTTINGRNFPALLLSLHARRGDSDVRSLIVPAIEYQARRFLLRAAGAEYPIRYGRLLEQHPDWVWTAIERLDAGPRAAANHAAGDAAPTGSSRGKAPRDGHRTV
ncbi:MAG: hypothetical protein JSS46_14525 [Proteobacteria bacterium]|jgi:hypothetical protein|nr:hypothetical protein [Pseudomonadota bacterium]